MCVLDLSITKLNKNAKMIPGIKYYFFKRFKITKKEKKNLKN